MESRKCACGCGEVFPVTRSNKTYASKDCRNRVSNENKSAYEEWLKTNMPYAIEQDSNIRNNILPDKNFAFVDNYLLKYGVDINQALIIEKDEFDIVQYARFVDYELIRLGENLFIIKKVKI
jgi:hypothetical protein